MIFKIHYNKNIIKATLKDIRLSRDRRYLIWYFNDVNNKEYRGITFSYISYGSKPYLWYSLLTGYFLPYEYNINFENIIGKECYIRLNDKGLVSGIVPLQGSQEKDEDIFK